MDTRSRHSREELARRVAAFALHTAAVYVCGVFLSPWLVGRWFAWFVPILRIPTSTPPADWYLQHLELVSIFPALVLGYVAARWPDSIAAWTWVRPAGSQDSSARWAWVVPAAVLAYNMLQYRPPSVLMGTSTSAIKYFFDIEHVMPTLQNPTASDPVRVLAQMMITAPFYAGMAYSVAAWAGSRNLLTNLFRFESPART